MLRPADGLTLGAARGAAFASLEVSALSIDDGRASIALCKTLELSGRVVGAGGVALPGALVDLTFDEWPRKCFLDHEFASLREIVQTDAKGRFRHRVYPSSVCDLDTSYPAARHQRVPTRRIVVAEDPIKGIELQIPGVKPADRDKKRR